jgi:uncharacterized protein YraI
MIVWAMVCCGAAWANEPTPAKPGDPPKASGAARADALLCVHAVEAGQSLPVRAGPGPDKPVTGRFAADDCGITLVGACRGDWCEMARGDVRGFVDTRFIGIYELPASSSPKQDLTAAPVIPGSLPSPQPPTSAARAEQPEKEAPREELAEQQRRESGRPEPAHDPRIRTGACVARVASWDTLRIRKGPGASHGEVGSIPAGTCSVERVGGCRGVWCRVAWRGRIGWVNSYYLE